MILIPFPSKAVKKARMEESVARREKMQRALSGEAPDLVIDLDFDGMMNDSDLKHLFQQVIIRYILQYTMRYNMVMSGALGLHHA